MPVGKRGQGDTMLYALIVFIAIFVIAAAFAIIFYIKFEEQKQLANTAKNNLNEVAKGREWSDRGQIVGAKKSNESYLGKMVEYLDRTTVLIAGPSEPTSAEVRIENLNTQVRQTLDGLSGKYPDITASDPLLRIIGKLSIKLDDAKSAELAAQEQLQDLHKRFDDAMQASLQKEQALTAEKESYQQQVDSIRKDYEDLKVLMRQSLDEQVQNLTTKLDEIKTERDNLRKEMLKTQAQLQMAQQRIEHVQQQLDSIVPQPDTEVAAFKPDGKVILVDEQTNTVHLDLGSKDRVYTGLTFSVYDRNLPIPRDGEGKAEVEIFNVGQNISTARILRSELKSPIVIDDKVANLIWDSDKANIFVIAGDFDFNGDGQIDQNADYKLKSLVQKWGGVAAETVTVETDFIILGQTPTTPKKPTFEDIEVFPTAMEKYERSVQKLEQYKEVKAQAQALSVPVFNYERFLYFIGYKTQAEKTGAF